MTVGRLPPLGLWERLSDERELQMALTLTEAAKLSNNIVLQGVVETIVKESPVLQVLPFIDIVGNALVSA